MKKIFLQQNETITDNKVFISGADYHHLSNVLRVKVGEFFLIGTGSKEFYGKIVSIDKEKIEIFLENETDRDHNKLPDVTLFFSILKGDKNEVIIQKCSEIGVNKFVPVLTKNCIVKIDYGKMNKIERWRKIAKESAMQSGRDIMPLVEDAIKFSDIKDLTFSGLKIFGHIGSQRKNFYGLLESAEEEKKIFIFIGPEGDFTEEETDFLIKSGWHGVNVSPYIFKSDTAGIFFTSVLFSYFWKSIN